MQLAALELQQKAQTVKANNQIDLGSLTLCPHDLLHEDENKIQISNSCKYIVIYKLFLWIFSFQLFHELFFVYEF